MKKSSIYKYLTYLVIFAFSSVILLFSLAIIWIGVEVKSSCNRAQQMYSGNCVEALIPFVEDEDQSFQDRNTAIWSLGQLGDSKALPVLETYYTGNIPEREPLDEMISQYELKKAINLAKGGQNVTALFWRWSMN